MEMAEALALMTHTCPTHGGRFNPSACDKRRDRNFTRSATFRNPNLYFTLSECLGCDGPVPIGSIPKPKPVVPLGVPVVAVENISKPVQVCAICGERDPEKFHRDHKKHCRICFNRLHAEKERKKRDEKRGGPAGSRKKPHLCGCGETDPEKFYPKDKSTCRACRIREESERGRMKRAAKAE